MWRYLESAYDTEGMHQSTPADREIIRHYEGKTASRKKQTHASLMKDARTFSVPSVTHQQQAQQQQANGTGDRSSTGSEPEHAQQGYQRQVSDEVSSEPAGNGDVSPAAIETRSSDAEDEVAAADISHHEDDAPAEAAQHDDGAPAEPAQHDSDDGAPAVTTQRDSDDDTAPSDPIHNGD